MMGDFYEAVGGCGDLKSSSSHLYSHLEGSERFRGRCELGCEDVTERCRKERRARVVMPAEVTFESQVE